MIPIFFKCSKHKELCSYCEDFISFARDKKLNYSIGGSLAYHIYFNKAYRPIKDLDVKIDSKEKASWIPFFEEQFIKRKARYKDTIWKTDLIFKSYWQFNNDKLICEMWALPDPYKTILVNNIWVDLPSEMYKNKLNYNRDKDIQDIKYYNLERFRV